MDERKPFGKCSSLECNSPNLDHFYTHVCNFATNEEKANWKHVGSSPTVSAKEEKKLIISLKKQGIRSGQIAKIVNRDRKVIYEILKKYGV